MIRRIYVVYHGTNGWHWHDHAGDHWSRDLEWAAQWTSIAKAKVVARRTGGVIYQLVPTLLKTRRRRPSNDD